ncbi:tail fiber assembly protein [Xenorhabdus budapestensis]|uniref:Tail fiber assembly protein n=1 Tax=Xenorhabdus budapestensis TaxID=290110 RepID=A0ABX7VD82_XENBU|nr:tail fiber assembly protein [Xenorhabdus budapestensis]QTL38490.1 tail fiber assembly protein [Xenorhabdus budapestensis]
MGIEKIKPEFNRDYDYFYSASASGFVYRPYSEPGDYPDDLKPVSDELHNHLFKGQANGKQIVADENGLPMLADPPPPTPEELQQQAESEKRYRMSHSAHCGLFGFDIQHDVVAGFDTGGWAVRL